MNTPNTQHITIDINIERIILVKFKQYCKNSQKLIITLTENQKKRPVCRNTEKCIFKMITPDSRPIYNETTINDDGTITIDITERCCTVAGNCLAELNIVDVADESLLCSMNMSIVIVQSAYEDELVIASPEFSYLTKLITENANVNDSLNDLQNDLNNAEETRKANENVRIINENNRIGNEKNRVSAESDRETDTAIAVTNANNAATIANNVAKEAENATDAAVIATTDANKATQEANTVIESMKSLIANDNILHTNDMGIPGGVATLDKNGYIPSSQLPSYVDDVLEGKAHGVVIDNNTGSTTATSFTVEETDSLYVPENGKIYVDIETNVQYRWSGRIYVSTGSPLSLGFTSSTAYPGDMGKLLEKEIDGLKQYHNDIPAGDIKFNNTDTPLLGANVQTALEDLTKTATRTRDGLLSADDKKLIDNYNGIQTIEMILSAAKWTGNSSPYTQLVPVSDLITYNSCSIELNPNATVLQETQIANANIYNVSYDENTGLTFFADGTLPTVDIPILLCVGASMNVVEAPLYLGNINDASSISYDNSNSILSSKTVQNGIDEVSDLLENHKTSSTHDVRYYTRQEMNSLLTNKSSTSHTHDERYFTEAEVNNLLTKYYLKAEVDNRINTVKLSANNVSASTATTIGSGATADIIISVATNGKTPILATCINTGNYMCYLCATTITGNNITVRLKNTSTLGSVSCTPTVRVIFASY